MSLQRANSGSGLCIHLSTDTALFRRPVVRYLKRPKLARDILLCSIIMATIVKLYSESESDDAMVNASASQVRGPWFESRWEHSSFSLKSPDFVPVAPRAAFSGMGQARIENNLFIYLFIYYSPTTELMVK